MPSPATSDSTDERSDRIDAALGELVVSLRKLNTRMNIVLGFLGVITAEASFLLFHLILD